MEITDKLIERFVEKVELQHDGCAEWTSALAPNGYGMFCIGTKVASTGKRCGNNISAHRMSYEIYTGPIPCINTIENSVGPAYKNTLKTHCARGHEYSGENLKIAGNLRLCRECRRRMDRESGKKRTARAQELRIKAII